MKAIILIILTSVLLVLGASVYFINPHIDESYHHYTNLIAGGALLASAVIILIFARGHYVLVGCVLGLILVGDGVFLWLLWPQLSAVRFP